MASSKSTQSASEIIDSSRMKDILYELSESADYVIIDTTPSAVLSDTSELAKF